MRTTRYLFLFLFTIFCTNLSVFGQVTVPKGSYIIPMDNSGSHKCCQAKVLKAYGLVYDLSANKIPVQWVFSTTKAHGGVDFSVADNQVKEYGGSNLSAFSYKGGPFIIDAAYASSAKSILDKWKSKGVTIHEVNSAISSVPVQVKLTYKPKAFIIASDNCKRKLITDVLDKAGIPSTAWSWGKSLTGVDLDCYSVIMVPHRKHCEWPTFSSDMPKIKTFLNNGGNLYAQCAATEAIEDDAKFLTTKGFDKNNQKENWIYPDAGAQVFFGQFVGKLEKEGGNVKSFQPTSGGAWRTNMIDVAHNKSGAEPHKAVLGHKDNDVTKGWVMYVGGHEFKCKTNSSRLLLNAFIMSARREDCPCYDFSPIYIGPGRDITTKTLTADWNVGCRDLIVEDGGSLYTGTYKVVSGTGYTTKFELQAGGTLGIGSPDGITSTGVSKGNIQVSGTRSYSDDANYIYNGSSAQKTGSGLPTTVRSFEINNASNVTIVDENTTYSDLTIRSTGYLKLTAGELIPGASNTVNVENTDANTSTGGVRGGSTSSFVRGTLCRKVNTTSVQYDWPVGTAGKYRPFALMFSSLGSTGNICVNTTDGLHPNSTGSEKRSLKRYWTVSESWSGSTVYAANMMNLDWQSSTENGTDWCNYNPLSDFTLQRWTTLWSNIAQVNLSPAVCSTATSATTVTANIISLTGDWTIVSGTDPLPVELVSFGAHVNQKSGSVSLAWKTATEVNNYGFDIERSADNQRWTTVGFVGGHGTTNTPQKYSYEDARAKAAGNALYYRLKQIDRDGSFKYSSVVEVRFEALRTSPEILGAYPNPFNPATVIRITLPEAGVVTLRVFNELGREVATMMQNEMLPAGVHNVTFNANQLPSGLYFIHLSSTAGAATFKVSLTR